MAWHHFDYLLHRSCYIITEVTAALVDLTKD